MKRKRKIRGGWIPRYAGNIPPQLPDWRRSFVDFYLIFRQFFSTEIFVLFLFFCILYSFSSFFQLQIVRNIVIAIVVVVILDCFLGGLFRPRLKIIRTVPENVRCGCAFRVRYQVTNRRWVPAFALRMDHGWGLRYFEIEKTADIGFLGTKKTVEVESLVVANRRGKYVIGAPRAVSFFPLNLTTWVAKGKGAETIAVYPNYTSIRELTMPTGKRYQSTGMNRVSKVSEAADFCGSREFRFGDNPRYLNWWASARCGRLIVKEFQEEYLSRAAVLVDTGLPQTGIRRKRRYNGKEIDSIEAALSLSAALAEYLMADECVVDLFVAGSTVCHFQAGRSIAGFDAVLDVLASVEPEAKPSITELSDAVMAEIRSIGSVLLLLQDLDSDRLALLEKLRASGCALRTFLIADEKKSFDGLPADVIRISPQAIFAGRVVTL